MLSSSPEGPLGRDIFREAQVHFSIYGRALPLSLPGAPGIMHWTYPVPLHVVGWRNIYTIHDAIPILHPDLTPIRRGRHARLLRAILANASAIVAVSEAGRSELLHTLDIAPGRILSCTQGVDIEGADAADLPAIARSGEYFLAVGSIEPRKNIERLVAAHQASGGRRPLIVVGAPGWRSGPILSAIAGAHNVHHLPPQERPVLLRLIREARALFFPSLAEGFGLPVAEAMALGVPVITSSGGATEEVAAGAALLVDPLDSDAIGTAISRLDEDDGFRQALADRARERGTAFSMQAYGDRLRALYRDVANG